MKTLNIIILICACFFSFTVKADNRDPLEQNASNAILEFYKKLIQNEPFDKNSDKLFCTLTIEKCLIDSLNSCGSSVSTDTQSIVGEFLRFNRHCFIPGDINENSRISINVFFKGNKTNLLLYKRGEFQRKSIDVGNGSSIDCFVKVMNHDTKSNKLSESVLYFPLSTDDKGNCYIQVYSLILGDQSILDKLNFIVRDEEKKLPILNKEKLESFTNWLKGKK